MQGDMPAGIEPVLVADQTKLSRRGLLLGGGACLALAALAVPVPAFAKPALALGRELSLKNLHTREQLTVEYARGTRYSQTAMRQISHLLRDHRCGEARAIDPALLEQLYGLQKRLRTKTPFHVISGYRSPQTNALMHEISSGVAQNSFHVQGRAIDIRVPGVRLKQLQKTAMSMKSGGVGYYPSDDFLHVDTGPIRTW
jgi:uncharacterized protein YcbK (DUF882 family)